MEIKDIYYLCKGYYSELEKIDLTLYSSESYRINNYRLAMKIVSDLKDTDYFGQSIDNFSEILEEISVRDVSINNIKKEKFRSAKEQLLVAMWYIIKTYELTKYQDKELSKLNGFNISLPIDENFTDFKKNIDDLEFVLTKCPFFYNDTETIKLKRVDNGSILLTFIVVGIGVEIGSVLMNNFVAFADKCIVVKSHKLTVEKQMQAIERANEQQKEKDEINRYLKKIYKIEVDIAIKELEEKLNYEIKDGDEKGRVEQSFEKFNKLIDKGMQISATIGAPEETKALFEPLEMKFLSLKNQIKLIEEKENKDENVE